MKRRIATLVLALSIVGIAVAPASLEGHLIQQHTSLEGH